jgi:hypothetical protein
MSGVITINPSKSSLLARRKTDGVAGLPFFPCMRTMPIFDPASHKGAIMKMAIRIRKVTFLFKV